MNKSIHVLVVTALFCTGVSGCQGGDKDATRNATAGQSDAPPPGAATPADSTTVPSGKTAGPSQNRAAILPKAPGAAPVTKDAAKTEAARTDSIRREEERANSLRIAKLDSVKQAEAARAAAKPAPPAVPAGPVAPASAELAAQGKIPYEENCRKCHGVRGVPPRTMQAKFAKIATFDAAFFAKRSSDSIVTVLTKGKNEDMTSFADKLSRSQMLAVAAYIRTFVPQ